MNLATPGAFRSYTVTKKMLLYTSLGSHFNHVALKSYVGKVSGDRGGGPMPKFFPSGRDFYVINFGKSPGGSKT